MKGLKEQWVSSKRTIYSPIWRVGDSCRLDGGFANYKVVEVKGNGLYKIELNDKEFAMWRPDLPRTVIVKGYRLRDVGYRVEEDLQLERVVAFD